MYNSVPHVIRRFPTRFSVFFNRWRTRRRMFFRQGRNRLQIGYVIICFFFRFTQIRTARYLLELLLLLLSNVFFFLGLMYEISEGGFLDIDVKIIDPDGELIYEGLRESSGKYTFAATKKGAYTYCFSNQMSTMTPKVVLFSMEVTEPEKELENKSQSKYVTIVLINNFKYHYKRYLTKFSMSTKSFLGQLWNLLSKIFILTRFFSST